MEPESKQTRPRYAVREHKWAPLFQGATDAQQIISELITAVAGGHFSENSEDLRQYLRQLGYVNLWFFLKYIAGATGPYDQLNDGYHLEMCNFRQSDEWMENGSRVAAYFPRSSLKSTIFTHGANTWEAIRNPDIRIGLVNAKMSRARSFMQLSQRTIDSNEFFAWLYGNSGDASGSYVPESKRGVRWNDVEMVLPNRSRQYREPTILPLSVGSSGEGDHVEYLCADDLVGLDELDTEEQATVAMETATRWFKTNRHTLLTDPVTGRVGVVATRYGMDDSYQLTWDDARKWFGFQISDVETKPEGEWTVYYRQADENGTLLDPVRIPRHFLNKLAQEDFWTYINQYQNYPMAASTAELYQYDVHECWTQWSDEHGEYLVCWREDQNLGDGKVHGLRLSGLEKVISTDLAGTGREDANAKTSRTSVAIWFMDSSYRAFRVWSRVGYFGFYESLDAIFDALNQFPGYIPSVLIEKEGMQKVFGEALQREQEKRGVYVPVRMVGAGGDKTARIRSMLGWFLSQGKIYASRSASREFIEEKNQFPSRKVDVLDESEKALRHMSRPPTSEEVTAMEYQEEERDFAVANDFGY